MTEESRNARTSLLYAELRWLMRLRWIASAAIVVVGLAAMRWPALEARGVSILALGVGVGAFNALVFALDRLRPGLHARWPAVLAFATIQLYADLVFLTLLALWTGGATSGVLGLFVLHMVFASLLQPRPNAYIAAGASAGMLAAGLWLTGQWPTTATELMMLLGWATTIVGTVYLAGRIARGLYRRELERVRRSRRLHATLARLKQHQETLVQQEKLVAMGQLAAGVAHEITNPLANMDSMLQLMQRNPGAPRPDATAMLREQVQRIQRTVNQLTHFAHPGKGDFEVLPVNEVVQASLDMLSLDRRMKKVRLEADLPDSAGFARLNRHTMEQVLTNLYRNALDAMAGVEQARLRVRTERRNGACSIIVSDNGCGIRGDQLPLVFDPFFTTKPVGQGTGLGLSISASLVQEHGGRIDVESDPGRGTTFAVRLPLIESERRP